MNSHDLKGPGLREYNPDADVMRNAGQPVPHGREHYAGIVEAIEAAKWIPRITDTDLIAELQRRHPNHAAMLDTLAACGDVSRNVMASPVPATSE